MLIRHHLLAVAAVFACLSVYLLNGAPLYYFDTAGYLKQGSAILAALGADPAPSAIVASEDPGTDGASDPDGSPQDTTVSGARSAAYALALALFARFGAIDVAVLLNLAVIVIIVFICARRLTGRGYRTSSVALIAASLGSLPFYVAFLMPDILAPVLILSVALLAAYADELNAVEIAGAVLLSVASVVAHPSHLLIAALMFPVAAVSSPKLGGRRTALILLGFLVILGVSERLVFGYAVERLRQMNVLYLPFLTARLIDDGPGYDYLSKRCPDQGYPTCLLYERLAVSDDPRRLDAPILLFSGSPDLGSFKRLDKQEQLAVSGAQLRFAADVVRDAPVAVGIAFATNVAEQLAAVRVDMTLLSPEESQSVRKAYPEEEALRDGRLIFADRAWLDHLGWFHAGLYLASVAVILALITLPGRLDRRAKTFACITLLGIFTNAIVCGGISEPADRYGARTLFLLPLVAVLLALASKNAASRDRRDFRVLPDSGDATLLAVSDGSRRYEPMTNLTR